MPAWTCPAAAALPFVVRGGQAVAQGPVQVEVLPWSAANRYSLDYLLELDMPASDTITRVDFDLSQELFW